MSKTKLDLTKYKWFQYEEGQPELTFDQDRHNAEYVLELHGGNVFGVLKRAYGIFVVHAHSPDIQFVWNETELTRVMQHSKGWSGKVAKVEVKAGVGGLDKPSLELPDGWVRITDLNSSNLNHAIYDTKRKVLYVAFHRGDSWAYENVTKKEYEEMVAAESRGRYFNYRIKYVKRQYMLGRNFDLPPFDVSPVGPKMDAPAAPATHAKNPYEAPPPKPAPKTPKEPAATPAPNEKPGHAKRNLQIPKGAFEAWIDTEQDSYNREHKPAGHAFEILRRQRVDTETDLIKLMASLRNSTLSRADHRAFKNAVMSVVSLGDEYPFTAKGKKTYTTLRKYVIALGKANPQ